MRVDYHIRSRGQRAFCLVLLTLCSGGLHAELRNGFELEGSLIAPQQIYSGGPPRDGIPALDYDLQSRSGRAFDQQGVEIPLINGFWFAWYGFHPQTEVYSYPPE